jgi:AcrR family transcriptional regulator
MSTRGRASSRAAVAGGARRSLRAAERREQLLDAAARLISDQGVAALTMERLAQSAGISKPVVYRRFRNRAAVLTALTERYWNFLRGAVLEEMSTAVSLDDLLAALARAQFRAVEDAGEVFHLLVANESIEPEVERWRQRRRRENELEWSARYQQQLGLPGPVADAAAAILRSALEGATSYWVRASGDDRAVVQEVCLELMKAGLQSLQDRFGQRIIEPGAQAGRPSGTPPR